MKVTVTAHGAVSDNDRLTIQFTGEIAETALLAGMECTLEKDSGPEQPYSLTVTTDPTKAPQRHKIHESFSNDFFNFPWPSMAQLLQLAVHMDQYQITRLTLTVTPAQNGSYSRFTFSGESSHAHIPDKIWNIQLPGLDMRPPGHTSSQARMLAILNPQVLLLANIIWHEAELEHPENTWIEHEVQLLWEPRNPLIPYQPIHFEHNKPAHWMYFSQYILQRQYYGDRLKLCVSKHLHFPILIRPETTRISHTYTYNIPPLMQPSTACPVQQGSNNEKLCRVSYSEFVTFQPNSTQIKFWDKNAYYNDTTYAVPLQDSRTLKSAPKKPDTDIKSSHPLAKHVRKAPPATRDKAIPNIEHAVQHPPQPLSPFLQKFLHLMKIRYSEEQTRELFQLIKKEEKNHDSVIVTNNPDFLKKSTSTPALLADDLEPDASGGEASQSNIQGQRSSRHRSDTKKYSWKDLSCYARQKIPANTTITIPASQVPRGTHIADNLQKRLTFIDDAIFLLHSRYIFVNHGAGARANVIINRINKVQPAESHPWEATMTTLKDISPGSPILMDYTSPNK